jgi:quinoprotein glucose dehydrogenase
MSGGREYIEHRGAKNFTGGGPASWNFNWTSPGVAPGGTITFYYVGNFGNNNNSDSGDKARWVHVVEGGDAGWRA